MCGLPRNKCDGTMPEGVAAPLEPSQLTAQRFYEQKISQGASYSIETDIVRESIFQFAEAYAAAVSKNLQQELAAEKASVDQLCGDVRAIQQDYSNEKKRADRLEKEITALREKP